MPNIIQLGEQLRTMPDQYLQAEAQQNTGGVPQFLVLAEMARRAGIRRGTAPPAPTTTVSQDMGGMAMPPAPSQSMKTIDILSSPGNSRAPLTMQPGGGGGLAAAAPGGPPQLPPRMMAGGGGVRVYRAPSYADRVPLMLGPEDQGYFGSASDYWTPGQTIRGIKFPDYPRLQQSSYTLPDPVRVDEPAFQPILDSVRAMRQGQPSITAPLEERVTQLEAERQGIRRPTSRDVLLNLGLGIMASRNPYLGGAIGEAGLGALANYREQQRYADQQAARISDRLSSLKTQTASIANQQTEHDINLASEIQRRQHAAAITEAQAAMSANAQRAALERQRIGDLNDDVRARYNAENQAALRQLMMQQQEDAKKYRPLTQAEKDDLEYKAKLARDMSVEKYLATVGARYGGGGGGGGGYGAKGATGPVIANEARNLINKELMLIQKNDDAITKGNTFDPRLAYNLAKERAAAHLANPDNFVDWNDTYKSRVLASVGAQAPKDEWLNENVPAILGIGRPKAPATKPTQPVQQPQLLNQSGAKADEPIIPVDPQTGKLIRPAAVNQRPVFDTIQPAAVTSPISGLNQRPVFDTIKPAAPPAVGPPAAPPAVGGEWGTYTPNRTAAAGKGYSPDDDYMLMVARNLGLDSIMSPGAIFVRPEQMPGESYEDWQRRIKQAQLMYTLRQTNPVFGAPRPPG